ncbi:MAG: putative Ig domain-containing protein [Polyangiales bacterium]
MTELMRVWLAASVAIWFTVAGCGGGTEANGNVAPTITSTPPTTATVGVPFNYTVTADGMTPLGFVLVAGPSGFAVHPTSGVVTWTPETVGTVAVEIAANNLAGSDTQSFNVEVEGLTGPEFTTQPPTEATVAAQYAYDPEVVANGDVTWSLTEAPAGLTIDVDSGAVRWTPTSEQAGEQDVTIRATEVDSELFSEQAFTVTVEDTGGPAVITSTPPTNIYAGEVLTYDAAASGAPTIGWSVETPSSGTPAMGVSIVTAPPEGASVEVEWDTTGVAPGEYSIALQVFNGLGDPNVQEFAVTVDPRPAVPEIDLVTMPPPNTIFVGSVYTYDVNLTPETASEDVVWSLVGATVPDELAITIDPDTGVVGFTASAANGEFEYSYTVRAENVLGEGDEATITVDAVYPPETPILTVTPSTMFSLLVGESFSGASASATGNPSPVLSISGALPDFLDFDPLTGLLSASASKPAPGNADIGDHSFDIVATNTEGTDSETIEITVTAAPPSVDSITPAAGRRQSDVPITVRGAGFVSAASPTIRIELGAYTETLATTYVDDATLTATVPIDLGRPSGVYDVVVDQGSTTTLAKRFTVTEGAGTILTGLVGVDITLSAIDSPHVITGDLRIENGATLTVEPGAVVMLAGGSNRRIDIGVAGAGALVADGGVPGVGDQVVFTRFQDVGGPAPGTHYRGLRYGANVISATTVLRNAVVEFGGRVNSDPNRGAIEVLSGSAPVIEDSIVRESLNYGLFAQAGAGSESIAWFDGNQLTANGRAPISIGSDEVSTLGSNLDVLGNAEDRIYVRGSLVTRADATWNNYGVPYYLSSDISVRGGSTMTVAPGTEMRFAPSRRLLVSTNGEDGTLVAAGTPEAPIRMVADSDPWNGVYLDDRIQAGTVLRNVRIEGYGSGTNGGLRVDNPSNPGDRIAIVENCLLESSEAGSTGVYLSDNARLSSFENNVLDVEGLAVSATMAGFDDVLSVSNIYEAPLRVRGSAATGRNIVWNKPVASDASTQPIRPTSSISVTDGSLNIQAGNRIEMPINGTLTMTDSQLVVAGTESEPVVFEPGEGVDYWNRVRLRGTGSTGVSSIAYTVLQSAGSSPGTAAGTTRAAITAETWNGAPATPSISNSLIIDSNGYGIVFNNDTHCGGACDDNTVVGSRFSALRMHGNFVGRFGTGNALAGNNTTGTPGHEGVWVVGDVVDTTATWPANDVPYLMHGDYELRQSSPVDPVPVWTIEPGSELRFANDRRLRVGEGNDGILDAQGTPEAPITFTSMDTATPVFWRGIDFNQGSDGSVLDHVVLSYGGRSSNTGNLNFRIGSVVTIGAASFTHSEDYAAVIYAGSAPMFTGPSTDRVYMLNGQESIPGAGDPTFDCVRDASAGTCTQM